MLVGTAVIAAAFVVAVLGWRAFRDDSAGTGRETPTWSAIVVVDRLSGGVSWLDAGGEAVGDSTGAGRVGSVFAADGVVSVQLAGQPTPSQVGTLQTVDFINPTGQQAIGETLYIETASSGTAQAGTPGQNGFGAIVQGALEGSNVNVVAELVNMIETQRAYEMNSKAISTSDQMMQYLNNNL